MNTSVEPPWWCNRKIQIFLFGIIAAYVTLYIAIAGALIVSPEDPLFIYSYFHDFVPHGMALVISIVLELVILTHVAASCMLPLLAGLSYVASMGWLKR